MVFPDSEELREELFTELARASGHSKKNEVFYPTPKELGEGKMVGQKQWLTNPTRASFPVSIDPLKEQQPR